MKATPLILAFFLTGCCTNRLYSPGETKIAILRGIRAVHRQGARAIWSKSIQRAHCRTGKTNRIQCGSVLLPIPWILQRGKLEARAASEKYGSVFRHLYYPLTQIWYAPKFLWIQSILSRRTIVAAGWRYFSLQSQFLHLGSPSLTYFSNKHRRVGVFLELQAEWKTKNPKLKNAASLSAFGADNTFPWYLNLTYKLRFDLGKKWRA